MLAVGSWAKLVLPELVEEAMSMRISLYVSYGLVVAAVADGFDVALKTLFKAHLLRAPCRAGKARATMKRTLLEFCAVAAPSPFCYCFRNALVPSCLDSLSRLCLLCLTA